MKSKLFRVNLRDIAKSVTVFFIATIGKSLYTMVNSGTIPTDAHTWTNTALQAGLASGAFLINELVRDSKGQLLKKEIAENTVPK